MNAQTACFTVSGEWLTDFARTRVIEGRWDHAIKVLENLDGITTDQILEILCGDAKLTGDSSDEEGLGYACDNDAEHKAALAFSFGGVWNMGGRFMRPYAFVTSWGPDDMTPVGFAADKRSSRGARYRHSNLYYADDPERDVEQHLEHACDCFKKSWVLFREVRNFPHLIVDAASLNDPQVALDAFLDSGGRLEERGYCGGRSNMTLLDEIKDAVTDPVKAQEPVEQPDVFEELEARVENAESGFFRSILPAEPSALQLAEWGAEIRRRAGDEWIQVTGEFRIPRAPFENWCLWRGDGAHLAMPWDPVCPSGLKMGGDDPFHTDFMVGAGLELDAMRDHSSTLSRAIWDLRKKIQAEKLGFKVAVLCGRGTSPTLKVVHPKRNEACKPDEVAVIPNAGPNYVAAAMSAGAVITEQGGAMAHLVTVSREKDVKIVRIEGARKLYPVGMSLVVDCAKGDVRVPFDRVDYKMKLGGMVIDVDTLKED